jgi:hypothetical protein
MKIECMFAIALTLSACGAEDLPEPPVGAQQEDLTTWSGFVILKNPSPLLAAMGITVSDCGLCSMHFPPGTTPPSFLNYGEIVDAFSKVPSAATWAMFNVTGLTATQFSWDRFFYDVNNAPFSVNVAYTGVRTLGGIGHTGESNGRTSLSVQDFATARTVMHEMGHVIHHSGIERASSRFYDPYAGPTRFNALFGSSAFSENRYDPNTSTKVGFVNDYSRSSVSENFAEHLAWYVYSGNEFRAFATQQQSQFNSNMLWLKHNYIKNMIFHGIWFEGFRGTPRFSGFGL